MFSNVVLAAEASGGIAAIVTALGGVTVSLVTVYLNSRKQASATGENKGNIDALTDQLAVLSTQLNALKAENATLKLQIQLLEAQSVKPEPQPEAPRKNKATNKAKKK